MDPDLYLQMARTRNEYCQLRAHCEILEHMVNGPGLRGCGLPKIGARAGTDFTMLRTLRNLAEVDPTGSDIRDTAPISTVAAEQLGFGGSVAPCAVPALPSGRYSQTQLAGGSQPPGAISLLKRSPGSAMPTSPMCRATTAGYTSRWCSTRAAARSWALRSSRV